MLDFLVQHGDLAFCIVAVMLKLSLLCQLGLSCIEEFSVALTEVLLHGLHLLSHPCVLLLDQEEVVHRLGHWKLLGEGV